MSWKNILKIMNKIDEAVISFVKRNFSHYERELAKLKEHNESKVQLIKDKEIDGIIFNWSINKSYSQYGNEWDESYETWQTKLSINVENIWKLTSEEEMGLVDWQKNPKLEQIRQERFKDLPHYSDKKKQGELHYVLDELEIVYHTRNASWIDVGSNEEIIVNALDKLTV